MFSKEHILTVSRKEERDFNLFWLGFILYTLCSTFPTTSHILIIIFQLIQIGSLALMILTSFGFFQFKIRNSYLKIFFFLYCIWSLITILRGYNSFNVTYMKVFFFFPNRGIAYFSPLLLFFPRNLLFYKKLMMVILTLGVFFILYDILYIRDLLNRDTSNLQSQAIVESFSDLAIPCGFVLLTLFYHSKRKQLLAVAILFLALFFAIVRARRGLIVKYSDIIIVAAIIYTLRSKNKILFIYLTVFIALCGGLYISQVYKPLENRIYGFLLSRGEEDTRTPVELYFYNDMKDEDWIIGRGIDGEYFCPDIEENQLTNYRDLIETGYLQTILKGGLISLILFLLIAIPAIIKGIFYSKNTITKIAGIWIFFSLINSYLTIITKFNLEYFLVWISIGICYSKEIRQMPEVVVQGILSHRALHDRNLEES